MRKVYLSLTFLFVLFSTLVTPSLAVVVNGPTFSVSTSVLDPNTNSYVDSLGLTDSMYHSGDEVMFHVAVANNGDTAVPSVTVQNVFPDFVTFVSGPGTASTDKKNVTFTVSNLAPHTTKTYAFSGKIAGPQSLPTNQGVVCVADKTNAQTPDHKTLQSAASFCIEKVFPPAATVKTTPPTGPEELSFLTIITSVVAGFLFKRASKRNTKRV